MSRSRLTRRFFAPIMTSAGAATRGPLIVTERCGAHRPGYPFPPTFRSLLCSLPSPPKPAR